MTVVCRALARLGLALGAVLLAAGAEAPLPIEGVWRATSGGGEIELHRCEEALCGRVIQSDGLRIDPDLRDAGNHDPTLRDRRIKGLDLFRGFQGGPDRWTDGHIYNPKDGKTYRGHIELRRNGTVKVTGCLVPPLCGSQVWTRIR
jgi:uncharacterized protein (DUF2147 family)